MTIKVTSKRIPMKFNSLVKYFHHWDQTVRIVLMNERKNNNYSGIKTPLKLLPWWTLTCAYQLVVRVRIEFNIDVIVWRMCTVNGIKTEHNKLSFNWMGNNINIIITNVIDLSPFSPQMTNNKKKRNCC